MSELIIPEAYELHVKEELPDIHSTGYRLSHKKTGAKVILIPNDDTNKVFAVGFRTPPSDDTGVPHIMEHSVLCGSRSFPVKDPFVELAKGSMNTFLNAMTYPDKTVYPVASCNDADFRNLIHIYLDAVFYPAIYERREIFEQEGWHYEMEDADGPLTVSGVVYNEMKGAYSSPDTVLERAIMNTLFPDTCYASESGGHPDHIPELTYEAFLDFHRRYYHPSNSYIYLYGDMDMAEKLEFIDREYLSAFDRLPIDSHIDTQEPFAQVKDVRITYPVPDESESENGTYYAFNKVIGLSTDPELAAAFSVLDYALLSAPGAPIVRALLKAGIGEDVYGYYEADEKQPLFTVIAKNAKSGQKDRFVSVITETLAGLAENGIGQLSLEAAINSAEFRIREADFGRIPKGLNYGLGMLSTWLHDDGSAFVSFHILEEFAKLREKIGTGYFEDLIRKYLLDNPHGSVVTAEPEAGLALRKEQAFEKGLAEKKAAMSSDEIGEIIRKAEALKIFQEEPSSPEDLAKIPVLKRSDMKQTPEPLYTEELVPGRFLYHQGETNGIGYLKLLFPVHDVPQEEWPLLGFLQGALAMVDTENYDYGDLCNTINAYTGGVSSSLDCFRHVEKGAMYSFLTVEGRALDAGMAKLIALTGEILTKTKWEDTERLKELAGQAKAGLQHYFLTSGHSAARVRGSAQFSVGAAFKDATAGISYYRWLCELTDDFDTRKDELAAKLRSLAKKVFSSASVTASYMGDEDTIPAVRKMLEDMGKELSDLPCKADRMEGTCLPHMKEAFKCASDVQYVARPGRFNTEKHPYTGALPVLQTLMGYEYLWLNIRVQGGAYGAVGGFLRSGDSFFLSFRDPHLKRTNDIYEKIPEYLDTLELSESDLTKYVIGTFSRLDMPLTVTGKHNRYLSAWISGITNERLQKERLQILNITAEDVRALADYVREILSSDILCVIGSESAVEKHRDMFDRVETLV